MLHDAAAFVRPGLQKHQAAQDETRKTRTALYLAFRFSLSLLDFKDRAKQTPMSRRSYAMRRNA
jgi:hypothetical protein